MIGGKEGNKIIVIDGDGNENMFSSYALLNVDEYEKAVQEAQDEINKYLNNKSMNQIRLW